MRSGAPKTREEDLCQNLLKIEVRRPKTLAPLLLCKRFTLPDSATPKATHTHIRTDRDSNRRARATEAAAKRGDQGRGCAWAATEVVARREQRREQGRGRAESRAEAAHGLSRSACAVVNSNNNDKSDNNNSRRLYS